MKFLIAGFGSIGRRHMRNLLALGERDILLYRSHKSTLPEDELAGFTVETDLEQALAHHPDAVIISNPTALHLDVAVPAAEAGCHLMLEKPIASSLDGIDRLRAAMQRSGSRALVGFQFRFHPGLQKISHLLQDGAIGRPLSARAHWGEYLPNWHPWEDYRLSYSARSDLGGGVVLTLTHPIDYLRWLMGEVVSLSALTGQISDLDLKVEDAAEIVFKFKQGSFGSLHLDYYQQPPSHTLEITGTRGLIRWDNADGAVHLYRAAAGLWETFQAPTGFDRNDMFLAELRHFRDVVSGAAQPACTLDDGVRALELALAVHQSSLQERQIHVG
jgi:predicted dehydrogenase